MYFELVHGPFLLNKMIEITLSNGDFALADKDDFELLSQYRWHSSKSSNNHTYARAYVKSKDGKAIKILMHRLIMNPGDNFVVDHINGNTLDNRKINLRICTISQNLCNSKKHKCKSSKYKGVHYDKRRNKYKATINIDKKQITIGRFETEELAHEEYCNVAKKIYGEFFNKG
jgi:hypothetical protein